MGKYFSERSGGIKIGKDDDDEMIPAARNEDHAQNILSRKFVENYHPPPIIIKDHQLPAKKFTALGELTKYISAKSVQLGRPLRPGH